MKQASLFQQLASLLPFVSSTIAAISTYPYPVPLPTPGYQYVGWQAYDPTQPLSEPALPDGIPLDFTIELDTNGSPQAGKEQLGSFVGVSIELSLAEAIIGPNKTWLRPQFLNLMSTVAERGGAPVLRVGGNTQEKAELVDSVDSDVHSLITQSIGQKGYTNTPTVKYTKAILEALRATSDLLGIQWFLGIPMNQTDPPRLEIVEIGESIMGDYLWGWQLGNEPDLYGSHDYRNISTWVPQQYIQEFGDVIQAINDNPLIKNKNKLGGPGVCCNGSWSTNTLIDQYQYLDKFGSSLNSIIIEHYPTDNCPVDPNRPTAQQALDLAMTHQYAIDFTKGPNYADVIQKASAAGKPVILLETNTASCNGFLGYSDAFGAALYLADLAMLLASQDWTHMMIHIGGQAAYYNPFVSPPHNATAPFMWTVGPPMYSILAVTEALGKTGKARVADLGANENNMLTPAYVVYEDNQPVRVMLFNFMSDTTGGHDYTARIAFNTPQVRTRILHAEKVTSKIPNITWAGQSFGGYFESDGLLRGEHETETVACTNGLCPIHVPGPSIVLVFLTDSAYEPDDDTKTFASSHTTRMHNTAAVDGLVLETSNGLNAKQRQEAKGMSTSQNRPNPKKKNAGERVAAGATFAAVVLGAVLLALVM